MNSLRRKSTGKASEATSKNQEASSSSPDSSDEDISVLGRFKRIWEYLSNLTFDAFKSDVKAYYEQTDLTVSHSSNFKENWDFLIMITACWNVFILPISIAF